MALSDRDYMRTLKFTKPRTWRSSCAAVLVAAVFGISAARLLAILGLLPKPYWVQSAPWRIGNQEIEAPLVVVGACLMFNILRHAPRSARALACFTALIAGCATLLRLRIETPRSQFQGLNARTEPRSPSTRGAAKASAPDGTRPNEIAISVPAPAPWTGPDGESLVVRPNAAKPGGISVELVNNPGARDPSFRQLTEFLRTDPTDRRPYKDGLWVCACYAEQLHNRSEKAGIRCAFVTVDLGKVQGLHTLNAFRTLDRGLVFVDCTSSQRTHDGGGPDNDDKVVDVRIGREYVPRYLFPSKGWREWCESMGVVQMNPIIDW